MGGAGIFFVELSPIITAHNSFIQAVEEEEEEDQGMEEVLTLREKSKEEKVVVMSCVHTYEY